MTQANEAGLGSTVTFNSMSDESDPHRQSLWATLTVFFDTIVICTLTALPILLTDTDKVFSGAEDLGVNLASSAFEAAFGSYAGMFVTVSVVLFAIATASGWSVFGASCVEYLFGKSAAKKFLVLYVGFVFIGAVMRLDLVWGLADMTNAIMAVPNLLAILILADKVREK